jgi:hypothetical protein
MATRFCYARQMKAIDRTGQVYGRLTVVRRIDNDKYGAVRWLCSCTCGQEIETWSNNLRSGNTTSCGCLVKEGRTKSGGKIRRKITHGQTGHSLFRLWGSLRARCRNQNHHAYARYGGRGIVCDPRWDDFAVFLADVGDRPANPEGWSSSRPYWTLDRVNPDGNYEPGNVRWASPADQRANRSELV